MVSDWVSHPFWLKVSLDGREYEPQLISTLLSEGRSEASQATQPRSLSNIHVADSGQVNLDECKSQKGVLALFLYQTSRLLLPLHFMTIFMDVWGVHSHLPFAEVDVGGWLFVSVNDVSGCLHLIKLNDLALLNWPHFSCPTGQQTTRFIHIYLVCLCLCYFCPFAKVLIKTQTTTSTLDIFPRVARECWSWHTARATEG